MKTFFKRAGIISTILAAIFLTGLYNSYILKIDFLLALHGVLSNILNGIWQLISNSVIFIILVVICFLVIYRKYIPDVLRRVEQFNAFGTELRFKESEKDFLSSVIKESDKTQIALKRNEVEKIVNTIQTRFCEFLINVDNVDLSIEDLILKIGGTEMIFSTHIDAFNLSEAQKEFIKFMINLANTRGYLICLINFQQILFTIDSIEDNKLHLSLYPEVKILIYERLTREVLNNNDDKKSPRS